MHRELRNKQRTDTVLWLIVFVCVRLRSIQVLAVSWIHLATSLDDSWFGVRTFDGSYSSTYVHVSPDSFVADAGLYSTARAGPTTCTVARVALQFCRPTGCNNHRMLKPIKPLDVLGSVTRHMQTPQNKLIKRTRTMLRRHGAEFLCRMYAFLQIGILAQHLAWFKLHETNNGSVRDNIR
jgi:hypothetical protein